MNSQKTLILFFSIFFLLNFSRAISGLNPLLMDIKIKGIKQASPPESFDQQIFFTYESEKPVRTVGIRFNHENYAVFHLYFRNEYGVFIFSYQPPEGLEKIKYRISVDGLWMSDPFNPNREADSFGIVFSIVKIQKKPRLSITNPEISRDGKATFAFKTSPGKALAISGDFNNWDPYLHQLTEISPGLYQITLPILPGRHYYTFLVDWERTLDPYNLESVADYEGFKVSTFYMPP